MCSAWCWAWGESHQHRGSGDPCWWVWGNQVDPSRGGARRRASRQSWGRKALPDSRASANEPGKLGEGECRRMHGDSVCSWGRVPGETSRRGAVRLRLKMSSPCGYKEVWVSSPGERGDRVGLLQSEGEERGPQPDGDLGSRFVEGGPVTEVRGAGGTLAGVQQGRTPFLLCILGGCRDGCKLVNLVPGCCLVSALMGSSVISPGVGGRLKEGIF